MKLVLCFLTLLACYQVKSFTFHVKNIGNVESSISSLIEEYNYDAEVYNVETVDGYILDLVRIPRSRRDQSSKSQYEQYEDKPAVLLVPGMMSTYEDFVIGGPSEGLAFVLADQGYDVYIANVRGSFYGQKHNKLDSHRDVAFWRHCWHEIGTKDLPAIVDKVITISGQRRINYIGHMAGTTYFYVMTSELPEYNNKIRRMISLGPIAFLGESENQFLNKLDSRIKEEELELEEKSNKKRGDVWTSAWMMNEVGMNTHGLSADLLVEVEDECLRSGYDAKICGNIFFLINGYNSSNINMTTVEKLLPRVPSTASSRQILHYIQLLSSGEFQKYSTSYDRTNKALRPYDLSKVTSQVAILYASGDSWSRPEDVQKLSERLPNVIYKQPLQGVTNNVDLLFSENVNTNVYNFVVRLLQQEQVRGRFTKLDLIRRW